MEKEKNEIECLLKFDQPISSKGKRFLMGNEKVSNSKIPLGDQSRPLHKSVPKLPSLGTVMKFGESSLEWQLKLLGRKVLNK